MRRWRQGHGSFVSGGGTVNDKKSFRQILSKAFSIFMIQRFPGKAPRKGAGGFAGIGSEYPIAPI
jgi:hypothetical protein